jgi:hypothetical protein
MSTVSHLAIAAMMTSEDARIIACVYAWNCRGLNAMRKVEAKGAA